MHANLANIPLLVHYDDASRVLSLLKIQGHPDWPAECRLSLEDRTFAASGPLYSSLPDVSIPSRDTEQSDRPLNEMQTACSVHYA